MRGFFAVLQLAQEHEEEVSEAKDLYPHLSELILGAVAFGIVFFFMWKWVVPRVNRTLEARRDKIVGDLEEAEQAKTEAEKLLASVRYEGSITWSEQMPTRSENVGDLLLNISILTGLIIGFIIMAGLVVGFLRRWRLSGHEGEDPMIMLHLSDK